MTTTLTSSIGIAIALLSVGFLAMLFIIVTLYSRIGKLDKELESQQRQITSNHKYTMGLHGLIKSLIGDSKQHAEAIDTLSGMVGSDRERLLELCRLHGGYPAERFPAQDPKSEKL